MFKYYRKEIEWGGRPLILETGKVARQADGAVVITYGGTVVLCTAVGDKKVKPGQDFFPLTVHYQEKSFAVGKIPGGFFKREGRASEAETLNSRLIDRPIRPLFPENFKNEVQVIATVLSHDLENDPAIVALIGCSAALTLSGIPFLGPIAGCRVGYKDGEYILNPTLSEVKDSELDLVVAGTTEGVLMVESEAKELSEEVMLGAVNFGHQAGQVVIDAIIALAEHAARQPWDLIEPTAEEKKLKTRIDKVGRKILAEAYKEKEKQKRYAALGEARNKIIEKITEEELDVEKARSLIDSLEADIVRTSVLKTGIRIDGRDLTTVRPIIGEVGILPRTHGSALFTRGETQALVVTTLGTAQDEQIIDALEGEYRSNFMLHYNFPPYSVGECGRLGAPGRREIGHGKLAWRAIHPLLPSKEAFPYTMRVVSEITESNGSSSMATVCGTSLSLMDAGVPMERPVAGIAMGLIKEDKGVAVLTDILGDEDHLGDMDFKVAGTEQGITALQMDIKITSITPDIMKQALAQAKDGRMHILGEMAKALTESRAEISDNAPHIIVMNVPKEKIRDLIGAGGKTIREIVEYAGCKIDIEDDGTVRIAVTSSDQADRARERIESIVVEPEVGRIYSGKVVKVADFGAFVNFMGARDGLVHISELAEGRVARTSDVVKVDDIVKVKVVGFDDRGKIKLSMREVDQETGADISESLPPRAPSPSRNRSDRPQRRS
ncbi:polynucleotide phosphorylase/polyadenylase [Commensalibacter intestini A911]|uniref:Polyribonucleotide nucleotidyltransferase n=2 Tax=Commensalibacter intestini TaxID=479936 RepID=A0A251ZTQ8_9PROT|nr:polyribonucleotide nucleotidyltransferase [Commensalibacter intestini]EHD13551.1 polynucleotide phosphorylase/polyadenylase [Commensalibacter intestini A911]OUI78035.1 polynucleotide phosphorylase/polyadenylase [Commensalibacter intestini]